LTIKIISHEPNKGLPSARNTGLAVATGEYIFHCDSDDWVEKDAMENMFQAAQTNQADIVWGDWFLSFRNNERYMQQKGKETPMDCIKAMLSGRMKFNVWNKLVKRSIYIDNQITFPDGFGMGEDVTMIKLFSFAEKVCYIPIALYHYVQLNPGAFTKTVSEAHLSQVLHNADHTIRFIQNRYGIELEKELQFFKLNIKLPFLITNDTNSYRRWLEWYPEANSYISQNTMFSYRIRFIQQAAIKKQFWIIWLYYYMVVKVVYGIIYR
jgi:glycosyltransferase involved in cell wall biosynthesis